MSEGKGTLNIVNPKHSFSRGDTQEVETLQSMGSQKSQTLLSNQTATTT